MLYVFIGQDAPNALEIRKRVRSDHMARLDALMAAGRLVLAGPCPAIDSIDPGPAGFWGSVVVAEFGSLDEAQAWVAADPFVTAGVYRSYEVLPFKKVLP